MNWLAKLKEKAASPTYDPAEPTKAPSAGFGSGWEASVANFGTVVNDPEFDASDLDRWCWPASDAMNSREIGLMVARTNMFSERGMRVDAAERLADALVERDRERDDRRLCMECAHLNGRRCSASAVAGAGENVAALAYMPQRCPAFSLAGGL